MGLYKKIELSNGVTTNYHRIVSLNCITNIQNVIEIASYTSQNKREEEAKAISEGIGMDVYINTTILNSPYDQTMTVETAYEWIKENVPEFYGSEDIFEDEIVSA